MILSANTTSGVVFRGHSLAQDDFILAQEPINEFVSGGSADEDSSDDAVLSVRTDAVVRTTARVLATVTKGFGSRPKYRSSDPSIATVNEDGKVIRVANGTVRIFATMGFLTRQESVTVSQNSGATSSLFNRWATGSLARHCQDAVSALVILHDPNADIEIYYPGSTVRNPSCWVSGLDLTSVAYSQSYYGSTLGGTLITPRHFLASKHFFSEPLVNGVDVPTGTVFNWVKANGAVVSRTMTDKLSIADTDLVIGKLDSDVDSGISFAKVLPTNWGSRIKKVSESESTPGISGIAFDQFRRATITNFYRTFGVGGPGVVSASMREPAGAFSPLSYWFRNKIGGDSGKPFFLIIDGELVLVTLWFGGGAGSGPNIVNFITAINAGLTTLGGGGYQLTQKNVNSFPDYG